MKNIINNQGLNVLGNEIIESTTIESGTSIMTIIEGKCPNGCLIVDLCDYEYQNAIFKGYNQSIILNSQTHPILSFTIDEILIELIGKEYFSGHYVLGYFFDSLRNEKSKEMEDSITKTYGIKTKITNNMVLSYYFMEMFKTAIETIRNTNFNAVKKYNKYII